LETQNTSATYDFYIYDPTIVYVDDDYNSSTPGWGYDHFDMIQDAINNAIDRDTIIVNDGIYNENILVNKELTIKASSSPVIDGQGMFGPAINIQADNVILQGFIIKNFTATPTAYIGAILVKGNNTTINSNTIENNTVYRTNNIGVLVTGYAKGIR